MNDKTWKILAAVSVIGLLAYAVYYLYQSGALSSAASSVTPTSSTNYSSSLTTASVTELDNTYSQQMINEVSATGAWGPEQIATWIENANLRLAGTYTGGVEARKVNGVLYYTGALAATADTWDWPGLVPSLTSTYKTIMAPVNDNFNIFKSLATD